ncbi:MAG: AhpC/TSA family protein [Gammaproteobacteria bacterium]|nr:AhpC/TSA family protein [Gammaproteobacteria bacterium]MYF39129.1 AhpC/TSA family protein [Gammaproteobacteria bacterium]
MRRIRSALLTGILGIFLTLACTSIAFADSFTVRGTLITDDAATSLAEEQPKTPKAMLEAQVRVLLREDADSSGSTPKTLVTGAMTNGEISLVGEIDKTSIVTILVDAGLDAPLTLDAVVAPGREISFALLEWPTILAFLGSVNSSTDPSKQFKISGDLSSVGSDIQHGTVIARTLERDTRGETVSTTWHVLMQNNRFEIIGEVTEPRVVNVLIYKGVNFTQTQAVIEPGAEIEVRLKNESLGDAFAISPAGVGKHAKLIDSWQQADVYWSTKQAYTSALKIYQTALLERKTPKRETTERFDDQETSQSAQEVDEPDTTETDEDECAQYALAQRKARRQVSDPTPAEIPEHVKLLRQLNRLRLDPLEAIADQAEDPIDALLALELGAYWGEEARQGVYDRLAQTLDSHIVARRVLHDKNDHGRYLTQHERIFTLHVGTKAPDFELPSFEGRTVGLYDVVSEHKHVLVEFWASWCAPCIAALPGFKKVYSKRNVDGFEVVSISVDSSREPWKEATEELELPWINLAELKQDTDRSVARTYGVEYIPKNYLLDTNGCIVKKDVSSAQLERILADAYDGNDAQNTP